MTLFNYILQFSFFGEGFLAKSIVVGAYQHLVSAHYVRVKDNFKSDVSAWASLGWPVGSTRKINDEYTRIKPTLDLIQRYEKGIL